MVLPPYRILHFKCSCTAGKARLFAFSGNDLLANHCRAVAAFHALTALLLNFFDQAAAWPVKTGQVKAVAVKGYSLGFVLHKNAPC